MGDGQGCHPSLLNCAADCCRQWEIVVFTCVPTSVPTRLQWILHSDGHKITSKSMNLRKGLGGTGRDGTAKRERAAIRTHDIWA